MKIKFVIERGKFWKLSNLSLKSEFALIYVSVLCTLDFSWHILRLQRLRCSAPKFKCFYQFKGTEYRNLCSKNIGLKSRKVQSTETFFYIECRFLWKMLRLIIGLPKWVIEDISSIFFRVIFTLKTVWKSPPKLPKKRDQRAISIADPEIINILIIRNIQYKKHSKKRVSVENHTYLIPPKKNTPKKTAKMPHQRLSPFGRGSASAVAKHKFLTCTKQRVPSADKVCNRCQCYTRPAFPPFLTPLLLAPHLLVSLLPARSFRHIGQDLYRRRSPTPRASPSPAVADPACGR